MFEVPTRLLSESLPGAEGHRNWESWLVPISSFSLSIIAPGLKNDALQLQS